jgi:UDP-MurNAc hydroxylase
VKLSNFGGATAILEHEGVRMLFDPWLDDGIFHGSWYHYPPLERHIEDLGRVDYVYISHIHEDHCSAGTIRHINRDAEILIMDRNPNFVARFLDAQGFRFRAVHRIAPRTELKLRPDLSVGMLEADPANEMAHVIDSALLLRWGGYTVYNANDCQPYGGGLDYLAERYGKIDIALLPYSGGSGYPSCYTNLSDGEKAAEKQRILNARLDNFARTVQRLDARFVVPFADQYVVAGSRSDLNRFISHPPCPGAVLQTLEREGLADRLVLLNSGQAIDFATRDKLPDAPYKAFTEQDRERYVAASLRDKRYEHEQFSFAPGIPIERLLTHARERLWTQQERKRFKPGFSLYVDVGDQGKRYRIRLDERGVVEADRTAPLEEPYLKVSGSYTLMIMLLLGHMSWNIADAALFLDYERIPNVYDPEIYVCLNYLRV